MPALQVALRQPVKRVQQHKHSKNKQRALPPYFEETIVFIKQAYPYPAYERYLAKQITCDSG